MAEIERCIAWIELVVSGGVCLVYVILLVFVAAKEVKKKNYAAVIPVIIVLPLVLTLFPIQALGVLYPHEEALLDRFVYFSYYDEYYVDL